MSAFSIPLSGLAAGSAALNVIANNLANLSTDGYKDQSLSFADLFNQMQGTSGNGDPLQVGSGVSVAGTTSNFSDGNVTSTGIDSNMALQGKGFFVVQNGSQVAYTRSGDFTVNSSGQLVTPSGELVMGYPATAGVVSTSSALQPLVVTQAADVPASATTSFDMTTNLNSSAAVGDTFNTPITVYDSLGTSHVLSVEFTKSSANNWSYSITLPAADTGGTGTATTVASGTLAFDSNGALTSPTSAVTGISVGGLADGASDLSLTWNLADASGNSTITQQNSTSATTATDQDGYASGTLTGYSVQSDGTIQGEFSNKQTLALGRVAVASFANVQGLQQIGNNDYLATFASGQAIVGQAGTGGNGTITGDAVESSNVSLSAEFAKMIQAQQNYQANAKALTTMNQISQATIQMMS